MKESSRVQSIRGSRAIRLLAVGVLAVGISSAAWAKPPPHAMNDGFKFGVLGDHRGDNKASNVNSTKDGYKDGGMNKAVLANLAAALRQEGVDFVLDVGDLATKWTAPMISITPDALMTSELAEWAAIWNANSAALPIFPVRGNQEVSASVSVWTDWISSMPGIGSLAPNGPPGEEMLTYSFKRRNCLFVGIDQYLPPGNNDTHVISQAALDWLEGQLPQSGHKFVFGHAPAFEVWDPKAATSFTAVKDGLASPYASFTPDYMAMRDRFWNLLGQRKAEYFCGHDHIYARALCVDSAGRWAGQTIIGNGGAPPPALFSTAYTRGPFAEAYAGIPFPTLNAPPDPVYMLEFRRVETESMPLFSVGEPPKVTQTYGFGYVVVTVHGSWVTAKYMAEPAANASFIEVESWAIVEGAEP